MQARGGPTTIAGLDQPPQFSANQSQQAEDKNRIDDRRRDDHICHWINWRQSQKNK